MSNVFFFLLFSYLCRVIAVGKYNTLKILKESEFGLFLTDETGEEEVLLPNKHKPESFEIDDEIKVFIYRDSEDRKVATTQQPNVEMKNFAYLEVVDVTPIGAFLEWGLDKHLLVPYNMEGKALQIGYWDVFYVDKDYMSDKMFATNKVKNYLDNEELTVKEGDEVNLFVFNETKLGYSVIINDKHDGLIYRNEVFRAVNIGDKINGYIKKIREDNSIDISLQPIGYKQFNDENCELIFNTLKDNDGHIAISDKSSPTEIYAEFGMSKKAFKKAVGALYKDRKIVIEKSGIKLV